MNRILDQQSHGVPFLVHDGEIFPPNIDERKTISSKSKQMSTNSYTTHPHDIFIVGYPKCGSTWLQKICFELMQTCGNKNDVDPFYCNQNTASIPFFELNSKKQFEKQLNKMCNYKTVRLWRSHFSYNHFLNYTKGINKQTKFIYITRNPKDTFVSYYFFHKNGKHRFKYFDNMDHRSIDHFSSNFCNGVVWYGNYWDHVLSWYKASGGGKLADTTNIQHIDANQVLFIYYEDLLMNSKEIIKKIGKFMGIDEYLNDSEYDNVVNATSFTNMKADMTQKKHKMWSQVFGGKSFFRKGSIGDWKNHMNQKLSDQFDNITFIRFYSTGIKYFEKLPSHITQGRRINTHKRSKL